MKVINRLHEFGSSLGGDNEYAIEKLSPVTVIYLRLLFRIFILKLDSATSLACDSYEKNLPFKILPNFIFYLNRHLNHYLCKLYKKFCYLIHEIRLSLYGTSSNTYIQTWRWYRISQLDLIYSSIHP